jgi:hypothetical protein
VIAESSSPTTNVGLILSSPEASDTLTLNTI